jgi:hypothetical protein
MRAVLGQDPPPTLKQQAIQFITPWRQLDRPTTPESDCESNPPVVTRSDTGLTALLEKSTIDPLGRVIVQRRHSWTMTHSHYVAMGGFALYSDPHCSLLRSVDERLEQSFVLDLAFLKCLAGIDFNFIPNISEAQINDKSKASGLAKFLVCAQACWFCVQCLSRLAQSMPISLLELNTLAHAICALLVYLLWWKKPLDIEEPNLIEQEKTLDILGMAYVQEQMRKPQVLVPAGRDHGDADYEPAQGIFVKVSDTSYRWNSLNIGLYHPRINLQHRSQVRPKVLESAERAKAARNQPIQRDLRPGDYRLYAGESLHGYSITSWSFSVPGEEKFRVLSSAPTDMYSYVDLGPDQVLRLKRGNEAFELVDRLREGQNLSPSAQSELLDLFYKRFPKSSKRFSTLPRSFAFSGKSFQFSAIVAGLVYGAIHLTAWNAPFDSAVQRTLWRASGLILTVASVAFVVLFMLWVWVMDGFGEDRKFLRGIIGTIGGVLFASLIAAYLFARCFLVVECFLSFRHLPAEVYQVPQWSQYFPHFV